MSPAPAPDRREALVAAACRMIARTGVRGLRVEEVAREAGASTALIYYHFRNRAGLLGAVMDHVDEQAVAYTSVTASGTGRELLAAVLLAEFQDRKKVRENSAVWGELRAASVFDKAVREMIGRATARWHEDVALLVRAGQTDGSVPADLDPEAAAVRLTALVEGLSTRWLARLLPTGAAHRAVLAAIAAECRDGLAPVAGTPGAGPTV
ncbi:AcrR family transcriptional regulator [Crossiella equi]|uniref:AcrR family transcriptional regulator n=2 Tax=Crossiella equi TaxID=130796 RepID=A0ABS5AKX7_9PSEU|nr:TetR/AcrR family transcriptional regulator [Crossiella equi]MBP2477232.1 AcrR family transcriptional regulator [Crossiella equi]